MFLIDPNMYNAQDILKCFHNNSAKETNWNIYDENYWYVSYLQCIHSSILPENSSLNYFFFNMLLIQSLADLYNQ